MKKATFQADIRTAKGRKVKQVRKQGNIPATIYGKGIPSQMVSINEKAFHALLTHAGESGLIMLSVNGEERPVLINAVQKHPVTAQILHVEFHQVNLKEKVKKNVPVLFTGEPVAVKENIGTLLQLVNEVEVEALPADIPEKFEVSVSALATVNESLLVKDIAISHDVTLLTDPTLIIAKIGQLTAPEPEPVVETPVAEGAVPPGEAPAEGEEGKAAPPSEPKPQAEPAKKPEK